MKAEGCPECRKLRREVAELRSRLRNIAVYARLRPARPPRTAAQRARPASKSMSAPAESARA